MELEIKYYGDFVFHFIVKSFKSKKKKKKKTNIDKIKKVKI